MSYVVTYYNDYIEGDLKIDQWFIGKLMSEFEDEKDQKQIKELLEKIKDHTIYDVETYCTDIELADSDLNDIYENTENPQKEYIYEDSTDTKLLKEEAPEYLHAIDKVLYFGGSLEDFKNKTLGKLRNLLGYILNG